MANSSQQPLASGLDPQDPRFMKWLDLERRARSVEVRAALTTMMRAGGGGIDPGGEPGGKGGGKGGGGGGGGGGIALPEFHAYANSRPDVDWNTCGQAAIGTMADYFHLNPYGLSRTITGYWDDGEIIDAVKNGGFGPDVIFGWGTSPDQIRKALSSYGINAIAGHSGIFSSGWADEWNRLLAYVYYSRIPVPVLVDLGALGGPWGSAHWPILWKMEPSPTGGMLVYLANWSRSWASLPIPEDQFLHAWTCPQLPFGYNHAGVYCGTPSISF